MLKYFSGKPNYSRREARLIEKLGKFGIFLITLKPEKIHVLVYGLYRISNDMSVFNEVEVQYADFSNVINGYSDAEFFELIVQALNGK